VVNVGDDRDVTQLGNVSLGISHIKNSVSAC
jgi:hypothetical protein